jgi:hypothetical protein
MSIVLQCCRSRESQVGCMLVRWKLKSTASVLKRQEPREAPSRLGLNLLDAQTRKISVVANFNTSLMLRAVVVCFLGFQVNMLGVNAIVRARGTAPVACIKHAFLPGGPVQVYECHPEILGRFVEQSYMSMPGRIISAGPFTSRTGAQALRQGPLWSRNVQTPIMTRYHSVTLKCTNRGAQFR